MSDRDRGLSCEELRDGLGAELALGVLPAQERAAAIAHLDRCPDCRDHIEQLTLVGDGLVGLLPGSEPPVGFEQRVLNRWEASGQRQRHQRRIRGLRIATAAAAAALAFGFGGWAVGTSLEGSPSAPSSSSAAQHALLAADFTDADHKVGQLFAYPGSPGWVYMSVDFEGYGSRSQSRAAGTVSCELERTDGSRAYVGSYTLEDGRGHWGGPAAVDPDALAGARLVAADGSVLATAHFDAARR